MAKVFTYMVIIVGLIILFNFAGLQTIESVILAKLGITSMESLSDIQSTNFYNTIIIAIVALIGTGAVIIGTYGRAVGDTAAFATIASTTLIIFIGDLASIAYTASKQTGSSWIGAVIFLIMTPLIIGYAISVLDWVRGLD